MRPARRKLTFPSLSTHAQLYARGDEVTLIIGTAMCKCRCHCFDSVGIAGVGANEANDSTHVRTVAITLSVW